MELWLAKMNPHVRSLQSCYREGKSRMQTYRDMVDAMLAEVRAGKRVCGAFYGHPGVFAWPTHRAIELARSGGHEARMDYIDVDALIQSGGVDLSSLLAAGARLYGRSFNPELTLKALSYTDDGDLRDLPADLKHRLARAIGQVDLDRLPRLVPIDDGNQGMAV